jgi:uncharacterized protein (DUF2236 family)
VATRPPHERTHAERMASIDGYFAPDSIIRRVGNSPLVPFLGGGPAVLLQMAHPLVAAGVVAHSDYRRDLWKRLLRTLRALYLMAYGTKAEAERAGATVRAVHADVRGTTTAPLGPFAAGTPYSADDPALMLWVHATLVEASLAVYTRYAGRLSRDEQERYYREMSLVARLFGTRADDVPPTLATFREYFRAQLESGDIAVTQPARDVAVVILEARLPAPMRAFVPAHRLACAGVLPEQLRTEYGLRWSAAHAAALAVAARAMKVTATPVLMAASRFVPAEAALARS